MFCVLLFSQNAYSNAWTKCQSPFKRRHPVQDESVINLDQLNKKVDQTNQQYFETLDQAEDLLHKELMAHYHKQKKYNQQSEENETKYVENQKSKPRESKIRVFLDESNAKENQLLHIMYLKKKIEKTVQEYTIFISEKLQKQINHLNEQINLYKKDYME